MVRAIKENEGLPHTVVSLDNVSSSSHVQLFWHGSGKKLTAIGDSSHRLGVLPEQFILLQEYTDLQIISGWRSSLLAVASKSALQLWSLSKDPSHKSLSLWEISLLISEGIQEDSSVPDYRIPKRK